MARSEKLSGGDAVQRGKDSKTAEVFSEEELQQLDAPLVDWRKMKRWRFWVSWKALMWYSVTAITVVVIYLCEHYKDDIQAKTKPLIAKLSGTGWGWIIPVLMLTVLSIPPLIGASVVTVLCGAVWGLWIGFAIVSLGVFVGEIFTFYLFKYSLRSRAEKMELSNFDYGCLAHVLRERGLWMAIVVRLSALPAHYTTIIFATADVPIWKFLIACLLSMPKQLLPVYVGSVMTDDATEDPKSRTITIGVFVVSLLLTIVAAWWIMTQMRDARPAVLLHRRRRAGAGANDKDIGDF